MLRATLRGTAKSLGLDSLGDHVFQRREGVLRWLRGAAREVGVFQLVRARPRLFVVLATVLALVLMSGTTVLAASWATKGAKVQKVKVVGSDAYTTFSNGTAWTDIPDMSLTMSVPKGHAIFLVTFSAWSECVDSSSGGACWVRVVLNGQPLLHPEEVLFDFGPFDGGVSAGAHSMQFFTDPLPAGSYEFKAQWTRSYTTTTYQLSAGRTMSVLRAKV